MISIDRAPKREKYNCSFCGKEQLAGLVVHDPKCKGVWIACSDRLCQLQWAILYLDHEVAHHVENPTVRFVVERLWRIVRPRLVRLEQRVRAKDAPKNAYGPN